MKENADRSEVTVQVRIVNSGSKEMRFYVEPWGDAHPMPASAVFEVAAHGPPGGQLEVQVDDDAIEVWGWPGSVVRAWHGAVELGVGKWERPPAAPIP